MARLVLAGRLGDGVHFRGKRRWRVRTLGGRGIPFFVGPSALARVERPTMVEFVSQGCPVCQRMEPTVALAEQHCSGEGVEVLRLDVGTAEGVQYGVRGVPTFLFLAAADQEMARRVGEQSLTSRVLPRAAVAGPQPLTLAAVGERVLNRHALAQLRPSGASVLQPPQSLLQALVLRSHPRAGLPVATAQ
ncbi:thioredoxin family protein [Myxococcus xanthus]|uniref:thioredoxin family protein n=1 Tax=Myxococcus xanthus TaxID=34 RepID=UPI00384CFA00